MCYVYLLQLKSSAEKVPRVVTAGRHSSGHKWDGINPSGARFSNTLHAARCKEDSVVEGGCKLQIFVILIWLLIFTSIIPGKKYINKNMYDVSL